MGRYQEVKRRREAEKPVFQKYVSCWNLLDGRGRWEKVAL
jgi:hypothetical protein